MGNNSLVGDFFESIKVSCCLNDGIELFLVLSLDADATVESRVSSTTSESFDNDTDEVSVSFWCMASNFLASCL